MKALTELTRATLSSTRALFITILIMGIALIIYFVSVSDTDMRRHIDTLSAIERDRRDTVDTISRTVRRSVGEEMDKRTENIAEVITDKVIAANRHDLDTTVKGIGSALQQLGGIIGKDGELTRQKIDVAFGLKNQPLESEIADISQKLSEIQGKMAVVPPTPPTPPTPLPSPDAKAPVKQEPPKSIQTEITASTPTVKRESDGWTITQYPQGGRSARFTNRQVKEGRVALNGYGMRARLFYSEGLWKAAWQKDVEVIPGTFDIHDAHAVVFWSDGPFEVWTKE